MILMWNIGFIITMKLLLSYDNNVSGTFITELKEANELRTASEMLSIVKDEYLSKRCKYREEKLNSNNFQQQLTTTKDLAMNQIKSDNIVINMPSDVSTSNTREQIIQRRNHKKNLKLDKKPSDINSSEELKKCKGKELADIGNQLDDEDCKAFKKHKPKLTEKILSVLLDVYGIREKYIPISNRDLEILKYSKTMAQLYDAAVTLENHLLHDIGPGDSINWVQTWTNEYLRVNKAAIELRKNEEISSRTRRNANHCHIDYVEGSIICENWLAKTLAAKTGPQSNTKMEYKLQYENDNGKRYIRLKCMLEMAWNNTLTLYLSQNFHDSKPHSFWVFLKSHNKFLPVDYVKRKPSLKETIIYEIEKNNELIHTSIENIKNSEFIRNSMQTIQESENIIPCMIVFGLVGLLLTIEIVFIIYDIDSMP